MREPNDIHLVNSYTFARRLNSLGMMSKLIVEHIPRTKALTRNLPVPDERISFSRGYSKTWVKSNKGFKVSNILFKIYGDVSGDPSLKNGLDLVHIATAWEVATVQYPMILRERICDISRFTYLIQKVVSSEFLIYECRSSKCSNKFILHEDCARFHCWACRKSDDDKFSDNFDDIYEEIAAITSAKPEAKPEATKDELDNDAERRRQIVANIFRASRSSVKNNYSAELVELRSYEENVIDVDFGKVV